MPGTRTQRTRPQQTTTTSRQHPAPTTRPAHHTTGTRDSSTPSNRPRPGAKKPSRGSTRTAGGREGMRSSSSSIEDPTPPGPPERSATVTMETSKLRSSSHSGGEGAAAVPQDALENVVISMSQLRLTKPAPEWTGTAVVNGEFKEIKLSDYKGKYLVFFFYPLDFTFVCPTEIIAFSERAEEFRSIGCEVVACSTDSHFSHLAWVNTPRKQGGLGDMQIPLLADKTCEIAKSYGVLKEDEGIAFRGLFIIDGKGNLRQITINDLPVGRSVDETLRLVQAFQFTDKHGEVCPAGWKPGKATMKPDTKNSKTYFESNN